MALALRLVSVRGRRPRPPVMENHDFSINSPAPVMPQVGTQPSMAPSALSHGDGAPGAGAEDCITSARRLWRAELGSSPRRRPTRRRAFPASLVRADGGELSVGWISCWTWSVGWKARCGRDVLGQRQVFLNAGSRGIFDRCFSTPLHYPH